MIAIINMTIKKRINPSKINILNQEASETEEELRNTSLMKA
jgi:hypothetical protein